MIDMYCIYVHTNLTNNKRYVGMTKDVKSRWRPSSYKPEKENTSRFYNAIIKYGWDGFSHTIVETNLTYPQAIEKEKYYIQLWKTQLKEYGYNIAPGGNGGHIYKEHPKGMLGKHHTEDWKLQHSNRMRENNPIKKGFWENREHPRGMLGKHHTEEHKQKLREIPTHKHGSATPVRVIYPNGDIKDYECVTYLCRDLGVGNSWIARQLKSKTPYRFNNCTNSKNKQIFKQLDGCIFKKLDNTEVND